MPNLLRSGAALKYQMQSELHFVAVSRKFAPRPPALPESGGT